MADVADVLISGYGCRIWISICSGCIALFMVDGRIVAVLLRQIIFSFRQDLGGLGGQD